MSITYVFFAIIVVILLLDFKKGVLLYAPLKLFFNINVRFGTFTFDMAMSALIFILFFFKARKLNRFKFPLSKYFVIYAIGYTLTCLYPDFTPTTIPRIIIIVLTFSYVYFYCLQDIKDIKFALICYAFFAIIMCTNGLLQPLFNINPLDDFLQSISDQDNSLFLDNGWIRNGQVRYRSFIPHAISYGVACCIILYGILWRFLILKDKAIIKLINICTLFLLLSGIIICGSRTPILGLLPLAFILFNKKYISLKIRWRLIAIIILVVLIEGSYILYSIDSLINSKVADDAGGSSMSLRISQYTIALGWFSENPWFGKGMNFDAYLANSDILGGESVWLPLIMNNGVVGVLSYAIIYFGIFKQNFKSSGKIFLNVFTIGWLIMRTATSLIGVTDAQFFTVLFIVYRYYQIKESKNIKNDVIYSNTSI